MVTSLVPRNGSASRLTSALVISLLLACTLATAKAESGATANTEPGATAPANVAGSHPDTTGTASSSPGTAATQAQPGSAAPTLLPAAVPEAKPHSELSLSPISLYNQADAVGKAVILVLIFSSFLSWTLWLAKAWEVSRYRRRLGSAIKQLADGTSFEAGSAQLPSPACNEMLKLAQAELQGDNVANRQLAVHLQERVHARIQRVEAAEARVLTRGAGTLATISAVAPFVGLFGTVWGIMHSFIAIAKQQSTNLSVVAPGIAEALFATALGLAVAVPAVLFYNIIARYIGGYRQLLNDASTMILCLLSQELDRRAAPVRHKEADKVA